MHKNTKFHIPDTFSPSHNTNPKRYESFQKLNLNLTKRNRAVASKITISDFINGLKLFNNGLTLKTSLSILKHLANELKKKNIHPEIQEKALNIHNDETEALWLARKKVRTLDKLPFEKQKTKLYSYLQRRGFNNELIISIARQLISEN